MFTLFLASLPAVAIALLATSYLSQQVGLRCDRKRYQPVGQTVFAAGSSFHCLKQGQGIPVVVLESGLAGSSLSWMLVANEVAAFATVCSYDRAGFGWSSTHSSPRLLATLVAELHQVLLATDCDPPYLLVGHSYGGLIVKAFAHFHPELTAGVILLDPVFVSHWANCSPSESKRLKMGVKLAQRGALLARFGVVRLALHLLISGRRLFPKMVASASAPRAVSFLSRLTGEVRKLPQNLWPIIQAQWSRPNGFLAIADYLHLLPTNARFAQAAAFTCPVPLTILSASTATSDELLEGDRWTAQSCHGQHIRLPASGHWVQVDQPSAVVESIKQMVKVLESLSEKSSR